MKRKIVTKKGIAHTLSLAMLTTTILGGSVLGMAGAQEVQAATPSAEIKKGDHVSMGVADDSYVGTPSWIVLDTAGYRRGWSCRQGIPSFRISVER